MSRCDTGSVVEDIMQGLRSAFQMAHDQTKVMITSNVKCSDNITFVIEGGGRAEMCSVSHSLVQQTGRGGELILYQ